MKRKPTRVNNLEISHKGTRLKKIRFKNDFEDRTSKELKELPAWEFLRNIPGCAAPVGHEEFSLKEGFEFYNKHYGDVYGDFHMINIAARMGTYPKSLDDFIYVHRDLWLVLRNAVSRNGEPCYTSFNSITNHFQVCGSRVVKEQTQFKDKHDAHTYGVNSLCDYLIKYVETCPHEHTNKKLLELVDHMLAKVLNKEYWETELTSWYVIDKANF